jgi:hypothetical protein
MVTEVNFKLGITAEEQTKADKLIEDINNIVNNHETDPDHYHDCLAEDINLDYANGEELEEVISELRKNFVKDSKIKDLIRDHSYCIVGDMYLKENSIAATSIGETEHQFTELDELSDAAYEYVRKNIDSYLSDTRANCVYDYTSDYVHLMVDVKALKKDIATTT